MGLTAFFRARVARRLFPKNKKNFWYCYAIYSHSYELRTVGKPHNVKDMGLPCEKFLINPYRDTGGKIPKEGDIIPCIKLKGWVGYYLVTKKWMYSSPGSDFACWDDGCYVNLKFHHCESDVLKETK